MRTSPHQRTDVSAEMQTTGACSLATSGLNLPALECDVKAHHAECASRRTVKAEHAFADDLRGIGIASMDDAEDGCAVITERCRGAPEKVPSR